MQNADRQAGFLDEDYRQSGVDIDAGNEAVRRIKALARVTFTPGVLSDIGVVRRPLPARSRALSASRCSSSSADGVGTKLKVAFMTGRHDTVGADLVNHCVNDILVQGAEPLFFLDYLATGRLSPDVAEQVVERHGAARAARTAARCIGGETAEMPGFYADGDYDIAGFIVGVVERARARSTVAASCRATCSSGCRRPACTRTATRWRAGSLFETAGLGRRHASSHELGDDRRRRAARAAPVVSEADPAAARSGDSIKGMAHITGGGLTDNLPRDPARRTAPRRSTLQSWSVPPLFRLLQQRGDDPDATRCSAPSTWASGS